MKAMVKTMSIKKELDVVIFRWIEGEKVVSQDESLNSNAIHEVLIVISSTS